MATGLALALFFGYLASAGPVYYVQQRFVLHPSADVLLRWCHPADLLAFRSRPYHNYLQWWATKGIDAALEEYMSANPQGRANGRQPFSSNTYRTSAAAASHRSP
jgi:hypothetical protein